MEGSHDAWNADESGEVEATEWFRSGSGGSGADPVGSPGSVAKSTAKKGAMETTSRAVPTSSWCALSAPASCVSGIRAARPRCCSARREPRRPA